MRNELLQSATDYGRSALDTVEERAQKIPTEVFVIGALGSIGLSLGLKLLGRDKDAEFVGHWVPSLLALGLLTKLTEHERHTTEMMSRSQRRSRGSSHRGH